MRRQSNTSFGDDAVVDVERIGFIFNPGISIMAQLPTEDSPSMTPCSRSRLHSRGMCHGNTLDQWECFLPAPRIAITGRSCKRMTICLGAYFGPVYGTTHVTQGCAAVLGLQRNLTGVGMPAENCRESQLSNPTGSRGNPVL